MCHLSYSNLHDNRLNEQIYLLMATIGSSTQKHGWGYVATENHSTMKCQLPAYYTTNIGEHVRKTKGPIIGHIRMASAGVPVNDANAHPFINDGIYQVHNGTLTPRDESKHVMKEEMEVLDDIKKEKKKEMVKRSDSLIFFERFMEIYKENKEEFIDSLKKTMAEFYGKFAFIYHLGKEKKTYIVRGRTADLHIAYLMSSRRKDANAIGYVVNTNKEALEMSTVLLSNLYQLENGKELVFTTSKELEKETIYLAGDYDVENVGSISETYFAGNGYKAMGARAYQDEWGLSNMSGHEYYTQRGEGDGENWKKTSIVNFAPELATKYSENIFTFMHDYSLSPREVQLIAYKMYGISIEELDEVTTKHFCGRVLEALRRSAVKDVRKKLRKVSGGRIPFSIYNKFEFPWMINTKQIQAQILKEVEKLYAGE